MTNRAVQEVVRVEKRQENFKANQVTARSLENEVKKVKKSLLLQMRRM